MQLDASARLSLWSSNVLESAVRFVQGVMGRGDFSPEQALAETKNIDPHMIPRVKMNANDIDVHLLNELGKLGFKRGKLMTAESHPEIIGAWEHLSKRAGMRKTPQLILTESKTINAMTVSPEEVVVTTGLLKILTLRELMAVLGHELGHETSNHMRPRMIANVVFGTAGAAGAYALGQHYGLSRLSRGSVLLNVADEVIALGAGAAVGHVVANQVAVRPTELEADRKGAAISGDPEALASALRKLDAHKDRHPLKHFLAHLQSGYPSVDARVAHLEKMAAEQHAVVGSHHALKPVITVQSQPTAQVSAVSAEDRLNTLPMPSIAIN